MADAQEELRGETKGKDWKMFPELFLTDKGAKIYDALNKHQEILRVVEKSCPPIFFFLNYIEN